MTVWWKNVEPGAMQRLVLLQLDVGGHSAWLKSVHWNNQIEAFQERSRLALNLLQALAKLDYDRIFWAGDGGVFAAKLDSSGHPVNLCNAADAAFSMFGNWKKEKDVWLRVTATSLELNIDPEPGNWCSPELNDFLKYERYLALPNAFVITRELCAKLVDVSSRQRFPKSRLVPLPNGELVTCYTDQDHPYRAAESPDNFGNWLRRLVQERGLPSPHNSEKELLHLEQCTVLNTASLRSGYGTVVLEPQERKDAWVILQEADKLKCEKSKKDLLDLKVSGTSMQVTRFVPELSDDPHPRLSYRTIDYVEGRAFHALLESDREAASRYRRAALGVIADGTDIPNILSTAIIVITGEDEPQVVIANRKPRTGGYDGNCWSVSIAEQFMPVTGYRGSRFLERDTSIEASVLRGLQEELIGKTYARPITISTHAFCLADHGDNFMFVSIADLRPLPFRDLASLWQKAEDRAEHDAIATLPANEKMLRDCMAANRLPADVWASLLRDNRVEFGPALYTLPDEAHRWQRQTHIRLALAWWFCGGSA